MRVAMPLEMCWHDVPGGTARTAVDLARALDARAGVEVVGVAARHPHPPGETWRPDVPVVHHRLPRLALYETWQRFRWPRVESVTGPVDVLHVPGAAVAAARAPLVVTMHDVAWRHHPEMFTRHGVRFFERALQVTIDEAEIVFVPSQATLEDCVDAGVDRGRLRHVPWGIDVDVPGPAAVAEARERFALVEDYVLFVGTLEPRKNLRRLLEAWHRVDRDGVQLVVVGPDGWGEAIDPALVDDTVVRTGFVESTTRDALYRGAIASVYPSILEGFGLPVLESMALGCPVVTAGGTATAELVDADVGITVDPLDPDEIAAGLGRILRDPALRDRLSAAGAERAASYTWDAAAAAVVEGYGEAVESGVPR